MQQNYFLYYTGRENEIKILITRNTKDFKEKDLIIQTAEQYLKSINLKED